MNFKIGHIDLFRARLDPAYELETDSSRFAFTTPGIPWCRHALDPMVVLVARDTREVSMYSPNDENVRYVFSITREECELLFNKYLEGLNNG